MAPAVGIPPRDRKLGVYVPAHVTASVLAAPVVRSTTLPSGKVLTVRRLWE